MKLQLGVLALLVFVATSCSMVVDDGQISFIDEDTQLRCEAEGSLILAAQAVPSASHIPCVDGLPSGWRFERTDYRSDGVTISFDSNRAPIDDLTVVFKASCESATEVLVAGASPLLFPADAEATFESTAGQVAGVRLVIEEPGYCAEFEVELDAEETLTDEDFPTWKWVERSVIDSLVQEDTDQVMRLDP